jgi:multidrug efflux system membrane fusion protein
VNTVLKRGRLWVSGIALTAAAAGVAVFVNWPITTAQADNPPPPAAPQAVPVSVAVVAEREIANWSEFSGRLEAVERVEVRSRVAGAVQSVHFREGSIVKQGDLLFTIDKAPYAAEVDRAEAQVVAAQARIALTKKDLERGQQLAEMRTIPLRDLDQRTNAAAEAQASLRGYRAALESARLNLSYTEVRAPVAGRVGKVEITVGNLVSAGPGAPVLTSLVSVSPIYASFNADEQVVLKALSTLPSGSNARNEVDRIPVLMQTALGESAPIQGRMQLIDNSVDAKSGTVRVRAVFDNADGSLMPGQFARLRMGQAANSKALLVNERAIGTDQNKKFVIVVDEANKAVWREVQLGGGADGMRIVTGGLKAGERVVVNGLQRVRPGALIAPQVVAMDAGTAVAQR